LFQDLIEGGRCEIQKPHTQNFATTHSLMLAPGGPQAPSSYDFGATFATNGLFLRGGVGHTGDMNAMGKLDFSSRLAALFRGQVGSEMQALMVEPEYKGRNFVASGFLRRQKQAMPGGYGAAADLKIWQYMMGYNQGFGFSPNLSAGASVQGCINLPQGFQSTVEAGFRYQHVVPKVEVADKGGNDFVVCGSVTSDMALTASYSHKVAETEKSKIWLATDIRLKPLSIDAHNRGEDSCGAASVGYQIDLRQSSLKGMLDSSGRVSTTVEERLNPAVSLLVSAQLDHAAEDYKFGFGMNVGGGMA